MLGSATVGNRMTSSNLEGQHDSRDNRAASRRGETGLEGRRCGFDSRRLAVNPSPASPKGYDTASHVGEGAEVNALRWTGPAIGAILRVGGRLPRTAEASPGGPQGTPLQGILRFSDRTDTIIPS